MLGRGALKRHLQQCVDASANITRRMHNQALNAAAAAAAAAATANANNMNGNGIGNGNGNWNIQGGNSSTNYAFIEAST